MKKTDNLLWKLTVGVLLLSPTLLTAQIQQTVSFDRTKLSLNEITGSNGVTYTRINYDHNPSIQDEGAPQLPYKVIHLLVPEGVNNFTVSVTTADKQTIHLENPVFPAQKPVMTGIGQGEQPFVIPNPQIYSSGSLYPTALAHISGEGYFDGDNHILSVSVSPVQYEAAANRLSFYGNVSVTVQFGTTTRQANSDQLQPVQRIKSPDPTTLERLQNIVENKSAVAPLIKRAVSAQEQAAINTRIGSVSTLPVYEYCIITSRKLAPAFQRLAGWKRMKGLDAGVVTVEAIYADPMITGDLTSSLTDNAAKIRQYLVAAWENGTKYVLMGGDYTVVPVRYGNGGENYSGENNHIPTDLYYSDLNSNWNRDKDGFLGEISDGLDYWPEIYVGRLLCTTDTQIRNYTDKLLRYEINPGGGREYPGNSSRMNYLKKAFYMQSDQLQDLKQSQEKIEIFDSIFTTQTLIEELPSHNAALPTFPTGNDAIREMKNGYGFFSWAGHAGPGGITTMSRGVNSGNWCVVPKQGETHQESANGIDNLGNHNYPAILYTIGCTTTPFDDYETSGSYNLGEAYTVAGKYGGPVYLGNTRLGYVYSSNILYNYFANRVASGETHLGIAEGLSKGDYRDHYTALTHNLIGCPELEMWTDVPAILSGITIIPTPSSFIIETGTLDKWTAHHCGLFDYSDFFHHQTTRSSYFGKTINAYTTMVMRPNSLPFIPPLKIQNVNMTGKSYIFGTSVFIGNKVGFGTTAGDVVLKSGAEVTFEISEEMLLDKGFEIERGGSFELRRFNIYQQY